TAASAPSPASRSSPTSRSTRPCCACSARAACCAERAMSLASLLSGPLPARAAAVAGAIGAAAITALYLVRLRRRRVVVAFAPLWLDALGPRRTTRWARRLRDLLSLLLALSLLGAGLLAPARPPPAPPG